ncbi:MAG: hypothetical protein IJ736_16010, partial [Firmicutes bacterium]|nr:hypothetical protein [Bacillota bacterium]
MATNVNRVTGLSGIDTESMVSQIMDAEREKYKNLLRKQKWTTWKQEAYREVATSIDDFKSKFLQSTSNSIRYYSAFNNYKNTVTLNGAESNAIKINSSKSTESFRIEIESLATADSYKGTQATVKNLNTKDVSDITDEIRGNGETPAEDLKFTASLDGVAKEITVSASDLEGKSLKEALNTKLSNAFGEGVVSVEEKADDSSKLSFKLGESGHNLSISSASQLG